MSILTYFNWDSEKSQTYMNVSHMPNYFLLNSAEHEIFSANMKMPIIVGIFIYISRENFMLS